MSSSENDERKSLSQRLHDALGSLLQPTVGSGSSSVEPLWKLESFLRSKGEVDAFVSLSPSSKVHLPPLDWNGTFRKGYSLLFWIRATQDDDDDDASAHDNDDAGTARVAQTQILYQFTNSGDSAGTVGISATLAPFVLNGSLLQSVLTIATLPFASSFALATSASNRHQQQQQQLQPLTHNSYFTTPFHLPVNEWTLVGISHAFPYLKRPHVSVSIDGVEVGRAELAYPVLNEGYNPAPSSAAYDTTNKRDTAGAGVMKHCTLLTNIFASGVKRPASVKPLQDEALLPFQLHIASLALYPTPSTSSSHNHSNASTSLLSNPPTAVSSLSTDAISPPIQAICAEYGPATPPGCIVPPAPCVVQNRDGIVRFTPLEPVSATKKGLLNRTAGGTGGGRGMGIPSTVGVLVSSSGDVIGEMVVQRLMTRVELAYCATGAVDLGQQHQQNKRRTIIVETSTVPNGLGSTESVPKIGLTQPKPSSNAAGAGIGGENKGGGPLGFGILSSGGSSGIGREGMRVLKFVGNVQLWNATIAYLSFVFNVDEKKSKTLLPKETPIPTFSTSLIQTHPLHYLLLKLHLALPPPGYPHSLQTQLYSESLMHLESLMRNECAMLAGILKLFASVLRFGGGGRMRDEAVQSGALNMLATLLRRVLLRAERLGIMSVTTKNSNTTALASAIETPEDELQDCSSHEHSCPNYIPLCIAEGAVDILDACCGRTVTVLGADGSKRPPAALHIRRTSDLALTALFVLALDFDLWGRSPMTNGGDYQAAALLLEAVVDRYCIDDFTQNEDSHLHHDNGYGWLLRGQITVQYLLDMIRLRFGDDGNDSGGGRDQVYRGACDVNLLSSASSKRATATKNTKSTQDKATKHAIAVASVASSLSRILYTMLKYSLSSNKSISRGEHDVTAAVAALSDCPLGSIGAHVILTALKDILLYCEVLRPFVNDGVESDAELNPKKEPMVSSTIPSKTPCTPTKQQFTPTSASFMSLIQSTTLSSAAQETNNANEELAKALRRTKSEIANRLGRSMLMGQFHDVVAPMLLSRTVFCGRRVMMESFLLSNDTKSRGKREDVKDTVEKALGGVERHCHWRLSLLLFVWITSIAGPEGEIAAKSTGSLLLASGMAGSLHDCLLGGGVGGTSFLSALILPVAPTCSTAVMNGPGSIHLTSSMEKYRSDTAHRLRIIMHLFPGLVASLSSCLQGSRPDHNQVMTAKAVDTLTSLISIVTTVFRRIYVSDKTRNDDNLANRANSIVDKVHVKAAKESLPPLLAVAALVDAPIRKFREAVRSSQDTDIVVTSSTKQIPPHPHEASTLTAPATFTPEKAVQLGARPRTESDMDWVDVTNLSLNTVDELEDANVQELQCSTTAPQSRPHLESQPTRLLPLANWNDEQLHNLTMAQNAVMHAAAAAILNAMIAGGGEASTLLWRTVVTSLTSCCPVGCSKIQISAKSSDTMFEELELPILSEPSADEIDTPKATGRKSVDNVRLLEKLHVPTTSTAGNNLAHSLLCHLAATVLTKIVSQGKCKDRSSHGIMIPWESIELCSATARLCDLVEEKDLLRVPLYETNSTTVTANNLEAINQQSDCFNTRSGKNAKYTLDQVRLLCALLEVMASGREQTGWCQLVLPSPPPISPQRDRELTPFRDTPNLLDNAVDTHVGDSNLFDQSRLTKYVDEALMANNYNLYHKMPTSSFNDATRLNRAHYSSRNHILPPPMSSSKLLLPILQPCLRIILGCVGNVRSEAMIVTSPHSGAAPDKSSEESGASSLTRKSLLCQITAELRYSLTAAIVGLAFPNARDVCLNALSYLRRAIVNLRNAHDDSAVTLCRALIVTIVGEMRARYVSERRRREVAQYDAYGDDTKEIEPGSSGRGNSGGSDTESVLFAPNTVSVKAAVAKKRAGKIEAERSREMERLILGEDLIPRLAGNVSSAKIDKSNSLRAASPDMASAAQSSDNIAETVVSNNVLDSSNRSHTYDGSEDFIMFPIDNKKSVEDLLQSGSSVAMGWSSYKGFGSALEKCCNADLLTGVQAGELSDERPAHVQHKADIALSILSTYLDMWDDRQAQDAAESELVDLFDDQVSLSPGRNPSGFGHHKLYSIPNVSGPVTPAVVAGSETAADAMTSYIELSSAENSRLTEIRTTHLPSRRYGCAAFAEMHCWRYWMEIFASRPGNTRDLWERCMSDGGRDYGGRLVTVPIHPQFGRSIPRNLDHSTGSPNTNNSTIMGEKQMRDSITDLTDGGIDHNELDSIKILVEAGGFKIVDITKKSAEESEKALLFSSASTRKLSALKNEPSGSLIPNEDDAEAMEIEEDSIDGNSLEFPENPVDRINSPAEEMGLICADDSSTVDLVPLQSIDNDDQVIQLKPFPPHKNPFENLMPSSHHPQHNFSVSSFSNPPDGSSSALGNCQGIAVGGGHGHVELYFDNCLHVKAEGSRKGTLLLTSSHLILEYEEDHGGLFDGEQLALEETRKRYKDESSPPLSPSGGKAGNSLTSNQTKVISYANSELYHKKIAAMRSKSTRWNISELSHIYLRRYRLRDSAMEMFFIPSGGSATGGTGLSTGLISLFLDFGPGYEGNERRDDAANALMKRAPAQSVKQWPDKSGQFLHEQLRHLTMGWVKGRVSNFDYLLSLNCLAGRSYNDLCQYPVMPWVLSNYTSEKVPDLNDWSNFRDLTKPVGALNPTRLNEFIERFETFQDPTIPPFMYGSHYSTSAGVVLHFLVRLHPFAVLHRQLQGGHFDVADRLFSSVPRTWDMCTGSSAAEVKELTPEWYCNPAFLRNGNDFNLGTSQEGEVLGDVVLPPWAQGSPEKFVEVMKCALESEICTKMLPSWIDLIFGRKQQGPEAVKAHNVFFYLTYYGSVDVASIEDEALRTATELQIAHFGQCPMQLFWRPHVHKLSRRSPRRRLSLSEMLQLYKLKSQIVAVDDSIDESERTTVDIDSAVSQPSQLPFLSAPLSYWVHLGAPPPRPHAALLAVRLAGTDRCLAVDAQGIFHSFRWAWKSETTANEQDDNSTQAEAEVGHQNSSEHLFQDKGCFVAQRELPHFRSVPRLPYHPPNTKDGKWSSRSSMAVVALSKTLFASRSLLLVVSDGDGKGSLAMQLVDPSKGVVKGEVVVPAVHSARITAISMDPIGTAAGLGGVGGELAIVGSADGGATVWRFISSQYLPLRPRLRLHGHQGSPVRAVAITSALNIAATVSQEKCCLYNLGNGAMVRSFDPPTGTSVGFPEKEGTHVQSRTVFAETPAAFISMQGFIVLVCKSSFATEGVFSDRDVVTLQLFTLEGIHVGSKALESWRGIPHSISATADGRAVLVCSGRGITIHRVSAIDPLDFVDEWQIAEEESFDKDVPAAYDIDFGPSLTRPVVAAAGCSSGALRLHALKGISEWSEENKKGSVSEVVGNVLAKPAQRIKNAVGRVGGIGSRVFGVGKDISREAISDVKEKGVGGFLGGFIGKK